MVMILSVHKDELPGMETFVSSMTYAKLSEPGVASLLDTVTALRCSDAVPPRPSAESCS